MQKKHQRGYNLVEVLIAMALLGVVLISIMTLFVVGRRNVYSGKQMTAAVSIGTRVLEDIAGLNKRNLYYGVFDIADTAKGQEIKWGNPQLTYADAAFRSTKATAITGYADTQKQRTGGPLLLNQWSAQLLEKTGATSTRPRLTDGVVSVIMMPRSDPTNDPPQFKTATILQIRVIVQWREQGRNRQIIFDTTKSN